MNALMERPAAPGAGKSASKKRILFVEDMLLFREPLVMALRAHGYAVHAVTSGLEAVECIEKVPPDLLLLDLGIPELDGISVLRKTAEHRRECGFPTIVLTAATNRDFVLQARELGVQDYLLKSHCTIKTLLGRIERQLADRRAGGTRRALPADG
ncbi:MAG TPA: response regulator [Phycisphaerae bacterium]|nr:response regulator [Phycisphaerae bacterium]